MQDVSFSRIPAETLKQWQKVNATLSGRDALLGLGVLPFLNRADKSQENIERNNAYRDRAIFFSATARTLEGLLGMAFANNPVESLPAPLAALSSNVDGAGLSLSQQAQGALAATLALGRHGLLVDYQSTALIKSYTAESIINWRTESGRLTMLVLQECAEIPEDDGFGVDVVNQYREFRLINGRCVVRLWRDGDLVPMLGADGLYIYEFELKTLIGPLGVIPFVFVGSKNNDANIDKPPMLALAEVNIGHYRNSADYEDSVFWSGQSQPYITGIDDAESAAGIKMGPRSPIMLPQGGAFGYAQPGINSMVFEAMTQKERQMLALGARLIDSSAKTMTATQNNNESKVSMSILSACAENVSAAYRQAIGLCAMFLGIKLTSEELHSAYKITPDYAGPVMDSQAVIALTAAWQSGVIALPDLRDYLRSSGVIAQERTNELIDADIELQGPALGVMSA